MGSKQSGTKLLRDVRSALRYRFNLRDDQAEPAEIDRIIRENVVFKGTNLWVLILAILVASIGLNVNSNAVIIGAMLISPLMGPIMGVGYGAGINDFELIRRGLTNLAIAALISIITSTLYFLVSPLSEAQSELFARTTPTIWDVLIALFGGMAGMIAATRKEKTNVVPGVAIATALMPPLCTAGYGIARGSAHYFFGAFYLFSINSVFIAFATLLMVSYVHLPHKHFVSAEVEKKVRRTVYAVVTVTLLPSIYLAYGLVTSETFRARAIDFVRKEYVFDNTFVAKEDISPDTHTIEVSLIGDRVPDEKLAALARKLSEYGLPKARLVNHQSGVKELDVGALKTGILKDILGTTQQTSEEKDKRIVELEQKLATLNAANAQQQQTVQELRAQYPSITRVALAVTPVWETDNTSKSQVAIVEVASARRLSARDQKRIKAWLKVKMGVADVHLVMARH
jgi:uncharacterized hydrophobic protein (TIGR00271 family)